MSAHNHYYEEQQEEAPAVHYADSSIASSSSMSYQDSFLGLFRDISKLQWVRESLSSHSKHYEGLQKRQKKEENIKAGLEKQLNTQLSSSKHNSERDHDDSDKHYDQALVETLKSRIYESEAKLGSIEEQLKDAEKMLTDLLMNKRRLDRLCDELHMLYDEVVPAISDNPGFDDEQTLKREVSHLQQSIPQIEEDIDRYLIAQKELHDARESIAKAMMLLPGASAFVNRQTMVSYGMSSSSSSETLDGLYPFKMTLDPSVAATQDAAKLAQDANEHLIHASDSCDQVPLLTIPSFGKDDNVASALSAYRDCKMQIETLLRKKINPRYSQLQSQIAMSRIHYEQKTIEWVDKQITMLERVLRDNGALKNVSLEREMGVLRMGSNAAMIAVAAEASGRVTVDDVLEVDSSATEVERNGPLPVYSEDGGGGDGDDGAITDQQYHDAMVDQYGNSSSSQQQQQQQQLITTNHLDSNSSSSNSVSQLPAYSSHQDHHDGSSLMATAATYDEHDQPPAYSTN